MATLGDFLLTLFEEGRIVLKGRPEPSEADRPAALRVLEAAFDLHRLDIAGPPISFDARSALAAADLVRRAGWFLVNRSESVRGDGAVVADATPSNHGERAPLGRRLVPVPPTGLPAGPIGRAWGLAGEFPGRLAPSAWPLSGVLSDLEEGPKDVGDLGGHPGLWMLYAERLAGRREAGLDAEGGRLESMSSWSSPAWVKSRSVLLGLPSVAADVEGVGPLGDETVQKLPSRRGRRAQAKVRRPRRGRRPDRPGGRGRRAPVSLRPAGNGEVGVDPPVRLEPFRGVTSNTC